MKTLTTSPYIFSFVPLIYPQVSDKLIIELRNEITNTIITANCNQTEDLGRVYITIKIPKNDFVVGNKYSFVIKIGIIPIYYGKLTILTSGTNVQNFEYGNKFYSE